MAKDKGRIIGMDREKFRMFMGKYGIGVILLIMMIFISVMEPSFRSTSNMINVATQVSINAMIAYGMCLAITTEGIDLSVGAQLALVSCVLGQLISGKGWNIAAAIIVALLVSTLWGFINGFLISKFNMFPFVVTLSTQLIIRGLAQVISGGQAIPITDMAFKSIYSAKIGPVPFPILVLILATFLMYTILHWTKFGRYVFAVGDNMQAAIASGVSIIKTKTAVYAISGLLAGIAGIIFTAKTASAQSNIGIGYETDAVAACVLGGTSFAGGVATVPGVLMGIFIIGFIYNGMNLIGIDSYYQSMTKGAVIIGAVLLDMVMNKKNS
ncbi:ABC transporter permease [Extibacter muris]|uniref:ABC transporter permease n=1 Tax=Extibacter muris TaxID=1796622 RepID=UPI001D068D8C|nr:ABC transporter permease [Extibacter muris]MCB6201545.1 ABC transporter permease [Extibacter muris]MCQ4662871.1 ABC transporter permease [Extibacter muris]MCQ4692714.1 ABC transporter permease [Extibacter muris]